MSRKSYNDEFKIAAAKLATGGRDVGLAQPWRSSGSRLTPTQVSPGSGPHRQSAQRDQEVGRGTEGP